MKYKLTPHQYQKLQNMIYNVIEDMMPEHVNIYFHDAFDVYNDINEIVNFDGIDSINFIDLEDENVMRLYLPGYFMDEKRNEKTPLLIVNQNLKGKFDGLFGKDKWHEQIVKWVRYNFPEVFESFVPEIKTVE